MAGWHHQVVQKWAWSLRPDAPGSRIRVYNIHTLYILTGNHLYVTAKEAGGSFQTQYPGQTGRAGLGSGQTDDLQLV